MLGRDGGSVPGVITVVSEVCQHMDELGTDRGGCDRASGSADRSAREIAGTEGAGDVVEIDPESRCRCRRSQHGGHRRDCWIKCRCPGGSLFPFGDSGTSFSGELSTVFHGFGEAFNSGGDGELCTD